MKKKPVKQKPINKVIDDLIAQKRITNEAVANKIGVTPQAVGKYRNGGMQPGIEVIMKWKEIFGEDLLGLSKGEETIVSTESLNNKLIKSYESHIETLKVEISVLNQVVLNLSGSNSTPQKA